MEWPTFRLTRRLTMTVLSLSALFALFALHTMPASAVTYDYDRSAPLEITIEDSREDGDVRIDDISFRSGERTVHASLVHPKQRDDDAKMPGVLFVHWLGDAATTNRSEFLADAEWLARRGVVSLIPDQPWAQPKWFESVRSPATDERESKAEVVSLRRSLDALMATPGIDRSRIAYVGHDFGAMYGALLAGVDTRPSWFVFMTPTGSLMQWFLLDKRRPPADPAAYAAGLAQFDIPAALARATFKGSLLQFAARDAYVSKEQARAFEDAVPATDRTIDTFDTDHALVIDAATDERRAWLAERLGVR